MVEMIPAAGRELLYREAINEALKQEMRLDENVIIMGEEIAGGAGREHLGIQDAWGGPFRTTVGLIQEFGKERVLDTPLSEAGFMGAAIGAVVGIIVVLMQAQRKKKEEQANKDTLDSDS